MRAFLLITPLHHPVVQAVQRRADELACKPDIRQLAPRRCRDRRCAE
jgi:hypothetical protein